MHLGGTDDEEVPAVPAETEPEVAAAGPTTTDEPVKRIPLYQTFRYVVGDLGGSGLSLVKTESTPQVPRPRSPTVLRRCC